MTASELQESTVSYPRIDAMRDGMHGLAQSFGNLLVEAFHYLALFAIGGITAWASVMAFLGMLDKGQVEVDDILLLFIYLELGAMVGIYFKTNQPYLTQIFSRPAGWQA